MSSDMMMLFVGLVFTTVFLASQILVLPTLGTSRADSLKLKQRLEGIIQAHGDSEASIIKEKYLNQLGPIERSLERFPGIPRLKVLLEQAGNQQIAYRFALYALFLSGGVAAIVWLSLHNMIFALAAFIIAAVIPIVWLNKQRAKRLDKFEEQLPEALQMMARALRTGYPFTECMKIVSTEMSEPISQEFGMTYEEINYGRNIEVAFALMIERVPSLSLIAMSTAIIIQRETGGNLAEVLLKISDVLRGRFKLQRRIKTLSAEGMLSAWVLLLLPLGLFGLMSLLNPDYFKPVYDSPDRMTYLYIFMGLELSAAFWIRRIITIDA
ncbi:MAG: type II secretion system F family protein [Methylobacter sp.]|uniref:type II secretion system F family protein n=1 Tax=Methylobacter sp. TaxID=2051955 RepID=UPI0025E8EFEA|nr:type II secretion system F family protein [Methylobacter sp.]MCK9620595.1 type II secretion system F family protein [Methylobacter sp.]